MAFLGKQFGLQAEVPVHRNAVLQDAGGPSNLVANGQAGPAAINLANILLLIPADIVSVYLTGKGIASAVALGGPGAPPAFIDQHWPFVAFVACAIACFLFRLQASKPAGPSVSWRDANWRLAFWTTVAFVLWAHAVSDVGPLIPWFSGSRAAFFAGLFGVFAPRLVPATTLTT